MDMEDHVTAEPRVELQALLSESCHELFSFYGTELVNIERADEGGEPDKEDSILGILSFTGKEIQGTLVLAVTRELICQHNQHLPQGGLEDHMVRDWVGELANQLLGRLKNKLYGFGATIYLSTPVVLSGQLIKLLPSTSVKEIGPMYYSYNDQQVIAWLEFKMAEDYQWEAVEEEEDDMLGMEGDMLFF
jgi:CheY-specific phosphatase CheX